MKIKEQKNQKIVLHFDYLDKKTYLKLKKAFFEMDYLILLNNNGFTTTLVIK